MKLLKPVIAFITILWALYTFVSPIKESEGPKKIVFTAPHPRYIESIADQESVLCERAFRYVSQEKTKGIEQIISENKNEKDRMTIGKCFVNFGYVKKGVEVFKTLNPTSDCIEGALLCLYSKDYLTEALRLENYLIQEGFPETVYNPIYDQQRYDNAIEIIEAGDGTQYGLARGLAMRLQDDEKKQDIARKFLEIENIFNAKRVAWTFYDPELKNEMLKEIRNYEKMNNSSF